ncbi:uncharacterized protein LOC128726444 [Anopheles nili]|uniref:uncharacterized protein LOC128726444 n=1 Tax=Anopheles nili TaxID=185578 RepID=UPI00237C1FEE|nr:uncharacterized protein LOC128726444 [Anopheles nili]
MAKLLAYYNLCPLNNIDDFLGLSRDVDPGCVINTLGRNIILVVKLSNQRQIRSWTVLDRLSSKVVYDFKSECYAAVFGGRYLRCWKRDHGDLNTVKKIKLYRTVLDLFTMDSGQTLLLYTDGSCESLESALETRTQSKRVATNAAESTPNVNPKTHTIRDVRALLLDSGTPLLTYFVRNEENGSMEFNYALLNQTSLKILKGFEKVKLERIGEDIKMAASCLVDGNDGPSLMSIWSDSRIFNLQLSLGQSPKRDEGVGNFIEMVQNFNINQPISMICIGKDYVAVYANNKNQDGATLVLFNVQFKVVQAKQFFKVYFKSSRFWVVENNILLAFGQMLAVVPFKISKEQLSDMIGSQRKFDFTHTIDEESINEECEFIEMYSFDEMQSSLKEQSDEESESATPTTVAQRLISENTFEEALKMAYRETLPVDLFECDSLPNDQVQIKLFNNPDLSLGPLVLSHEFEIMLEEMERSGFSEMEICDKVVPWLVQADLPYDLGKCLKRYSTISEKTIVKALKYAMSLPNEQKKESMDSEDMPQSNGTAAVSKKIDSELPNQDIFANAQANDPSQRDLLNLVLSCSFSRTSLIPFVRMELDIVTVMSLLEHLEYLLVDPMATLSETLHNKDSFDSDEQAIQWVMVLLDSHYQQFILSPEDKVQKQLQRLLEIVDRHIGLVQQLQLLGPIIQRLVEHSPQNNKAGARTSRSQWYTVEKIKLF